MIIGQLRRIVEINRCCQGVIKVQMRQGSRVTKVVRAAATTIERLDGRDERWLDRQILNTMTLSKAL